MNIVRKVWENKRLILQGLWNFLFRKSEIEEIAKGRKEECMKCEFLDKEGTGPEVVVKGKPACGFCGCNIEIMIRSMEKQCELKKWKK